MKKVLSKYTDGKSKLISGMALAVFFSFIGRSAAVHASLVDIAEGGVNDIDTNAPSTGVTGVIESITYILLWLVGATAVIVIIINGIRFIVSNGDAQATANARNGILYAIVGVIVAFIAWGLVNWVLGQLNPPPVEDAEAYLSMWYV